MAAWGLALAAIPWSLATNAFGYDAERLAATSLPDGIEVYLLRDAVRGCHADIDVRIQLDAESAIPMDQVHRLLPRIGAAAAEHCPVAVAARGFRGTVHPFLSGLHRWHDLQESQGGVRWPGWPVLLFRDTRIM